MTNTSIKHKWLFPSAALLALWENEISGQLSDGAWENSAPQEHWRFWSDIEKAVAPDGKWSFTKGSAGGWPKKRTGYNLSTLICPECDLSQRMRAFYVDGLLDIGLGRHTEYYVGKDLKEALELKKYSFLKEEIEKMEADGTLADKLIWLANGMADYSKADLRKSLAEIKKQMSVILAHF